MIGLVIGGAVGSIGGGLAVRASSQNPTVSDFLSGFFILGAIGAGIGAAFGYTVEKWVDRNRPDVLYVAN